MEKEKEVQNDDVLIVKEKGKNNTKAVTGLDKDGNILSTEPKRSNASSFMRISSSDMLENFMTNFMRQAKEPYRFNFFKISARDIENNIKKLNDAIIKPDDAANKELLNKCIINKKKFAMENQSVKSQDTVLDKEKIDWSQFEKIGVSREYLEKKGCLDEMLNYNKSSRLIPITVKLGDMTLRTEARLSLRKSEDGTLIPVTHGISKEPNINRPFYNVQLSDEVKDNLLKTGNAGQLIQIEPKAGETANVFVSLDKLTNNLVAVRADRINIPDEIKGVKLDEEQKTALSEGKSIRVENMISKNKEPFSANIQINADKRGLEFQFDNTQKLSKGENVSIPKTLLGKALSEDETAKLKEGKSVYIKDMTNREGEKFNSYVKVNPEMKKLDFFKYNPDKKASQSEDKDNTKSVKKEIKQDTKTEAKQGTKQAPPKKSKGMKI